MERNESRVFGWIAYLETDEGRGHLMFFRDLN